MTYLLFRQALLDRGWVLGNDRVWRTAISANLSGIGVPDDDILDLCTEHGNLLHTMILNQVDRGAKGWNVVVTQNGLQITTNLQMFW